MKTLIFKSDRDLKARFYNSSKKVEFVKEGSIQDALNYFDGSRFSGSSFYYSEGDEGFNEEIDSEWYFTDSSGNVILTSSDINEFGEASIDVDPGANKGLWTSNIERLTDDEIEALIEQKENELLNEYFEFVNKTKEEIKVAEYFNDYSTLNESIDGRYVEENFEVFETEPKEGDFFEFDSKFYIR